MFVGHTPTRFCSGSHEVVSIVESEFRLSNLPILNSVDTSELIVAGRYRGKSVEIVCHNETSLRSVIVSLIADILKALDLYDKVTIRQHTTLEVNECVDMVALSLHGIVLLVIAIKPLSEQVNADLMHRQTLGRVFDYLRVNRECSSTLRYCFGLWATYDSCRLLWLNDDAHNALAQTEDMTDSSKFPLPSAEYDWDSRYVCASKIYTKKDNIPKLLACLIWKLYNSQREIKTVCSQHASMMTFRAVNAKGYFFQAPNSETIEQLTFRLPRSDTKQFYLIRQFNGRDGKVWLSISKSGRLAMIKFRKCRYGEEISDDLVRSELKVWRKAYKHLNCMKPFVVTLANSKALVMPFCFCYDLNGVLPLDLPSYLPCDSNVFFDTGLSDWREIQTLLRSVDTAVNNLFSAIQTLARKRVFHRDIKWEHLVLYPVFEEKTVVRLEPILIDLAEVEIMSAEEEALSCMYHRVIQSNMLIGADQRSAFEKLFQEYQSIRAVQASQAIGLSHHPRVFEEKEKQEREIGRGRVSER
jgi:hypothetical protein